MITPILVSIIAIIVYILLTLLPKPFGKIFSLLYLFLFFLFTRVHISEKQGGFYTALILGVFILELLNFGLIEVDKYTFKSYTFTGTAFALLSVFIGFILFLFMRFLGSTTPTAIIGVPGLLQIGAEATKSIAIAGVGLLGIVENRFFIGLISAFKKLFGLTPYIRIIPFLIIILPFILASFLFAIFHGTIILGGAGFLIFAFLIFLIWSILAYTPLGELPGEVSHYLWNVVLSIGKIVQIG